MSRVQLALRVADLEGSVAFYSKLFGAEPAKRRPGYANFAIAEPPPRPRQPGNGATRWGNLLLSPRGRRSGGSPATGLPPTAPCAQFAAASASRSCARPAPKLQSARSVSTRLTRMFLGSIPAFAAARSAIRA